MKNKGQFQDEWGRGKARERYADGGEIGTDSYYANMEKKLGISEKNRNYGDPAKGRSMESAAAEAARDAAAKKTRNTRSMPDAFPVGGEPKE